MLNVDLKIAIVGDMAVGKTCLMNRFIDNKFPEHTESTMSAVFRKKKIVVEGKSFVF